MLHHYVNLHFGIHLRHGRFSFNVIWENSIPSFGHHFAFGDQVYRFTYISTTKGIRGAFPRRAFAEPFLGEGTWYFPFLPYPRWGASPTILKCSLLGFAWHVAFANILLRRVAV